MRNLIWHMHVSLDGFVAGPNGEMDWIVVDEEIFEHGHQAIASADTAIYGRGALVAGAKRKAEVSGLSQGSWG